MQSRAGSRWICAGMVLAWSLGAEEKVDLYTIHRIKQEAFENSKVMDHVFWLTDVHGPRLTNSPGYRAAADWAVKRVTEYGLVNAAKEKWGPFGRGWALVKFNAHLREPQSAPLIGFPLAWTPGTEGPVAGEPVFAPLRTEADFNRYKGKLKGKIVLIDAMRATPLQTAAQARRYSDAELIERALAPEPARPFGPRRPGDPPPPAADQAVPGEAQPPNREQQRRFRTRLAAFLKEEGVLVALSSGSRGDGGTLFAAAGGSRDPKDPVPPPMVALTPEHYNRIVRLIEKKQPARVEVDVQTRFYDDDQDSFNVVAEIPGQRKSNEVVMLGAHLDSWHGGTGASDNAAGSAVVIEAVRILKALNIGFDRTVRMALWGGEEQGLLGSKAYVKEHFADPEKMQLKPEHARLAGYFNFDNGTGKIRGVYLQGNDMIKPVFDAWLAPFKEYGATTLAIRNTTGTDHLSFDAVGLPGFQFIQDPVEYETRTHHSNMDVYDRIQAADLMQASAIMASFVYHAAIRDQVLPRKPLPKPQPARREGDPRPAEPRQTSETPLKRDIEFANVGGESLTLDAYVPPGTGPFPAVIVVHGGGFMRGDKQTFVPPLFEPLTRGGFAWFTINYRLAPKSRFPAAVEDVERAAQWVKAHAAEYKVDPKRIALVGESAGGHLVAYAGARNRAGIAAVVSFYGVHNFESRARADKKISETTAAFLGVTDLNEASFKKMREASPVAHVSKAMPPFLLIHGTKDALVPHEQSVEMCDRMKKAGASCELFTVENGPHGVGNWEKEPLFQGYKQKLIDWLKATLK